jgi:acyl dehydratase
MTTQAEPTVRGLWYEDFVIGEERVSPGRTVTEADIVNYASLTGDFSQMHTDEEFSKTTEFGTRIAHGMLGVSLASALCLRTLYTRGTAVATLSWGKWQFRKPLYIGDTVHTRWRFTDKRESKSRLDAGIVTEFIELINQNDEVVQDGEHVLMMKKRPRDA